jgi:hypothetical protein
VIWSGCDWRGLSKYTDTKAISKSRERMLHDFPDKLFGRFPALCD